MTTLAEVFAPAGMLADHFPDFSYREPQARMALEVERAFDRGVHAVLEAGTGIGKTFAYVVPVLMSGRRAIISTGTKTLQDQLFTRDLPALGRALGRPVDVAVLKGRANYLCWHRLENARRDGRLPPKLAGDIDALARFGRESDSGDLSEIDELETDYALKARVTSTADNCLGGQCEAIERCFVAKARRRAQAARVVIVNHHLLLADLGLKEAGFAELLPGADCVVVDEAHLLPDIAQQFFDLSVSSRQLTRLGHDIADEARAAGAGAALEALGLALAQSVAGLGTSARGAGADGGVGRNAGSGAARRSRGAPGPGRGPGLPPGHEPGRRLGLPPALEPELRALMADLETLAEGLRGFDDEAGLNRCRERCLAAAERLGAVLDGDTDKGLKWLDAGDSGVAVHFTPFDVGRELAARIADQGGSWVFTSASLAVGDDFSHFTERLGIAPPVEAVLPSPFDYARQGRLYLPAGLPAPGEPAHTAALLEAVWPLLEAAGGGAFLLFTSHRALAAAERWLGFRALPGPLFVQGMGARSRLLEAFRDAGNGILLGAGSFWQGVDVRGPALRLVVIDKLPFAVPGDPLVQARIEAIKRAGGDAFRAFQLPEAVLALKQGVGRLIRDFDDRGLVVLGDPRLATRAYGRLFLESLPPLTRIESADEALTFAASLRAVPEQMTA